MKLPFSRPAAVFTILIGAAITLLAAASYQAPFGPWKRASDKPVLSPTGDLAGIFNPAVVKRGDQFFMLARAQNKAGTSFLQSATSRDGLHFNLGEIALRPEAAYEKGGGVEDPRLVLINGTYYLTYTGYNKKDAQLCLATSKDLTHWKREGVILPAYKGNWNVGWTKSGAILAEMVSGKYWMYFLGTGSDKKDETGLASSTDLIHWTEETKTPALPKRPGLWDERVVEPGPPPIMTKDGILLIYNGADEKLVYQTGWALFDKNNPRKLIARSEKPIFSPVHEWEKVGQVPNVVFVEGLVREGKRWLFYYGGADTYVAVAEAQTR